MVISAVVITVSKTFNIFIRKSGLKLSKPFQGLLLTFPTSIAILFLLILVAPTYTPVVEMKNDDGQHLVFLGIQHIGTKAYYNEINERLTTLRSNGHTILHEGIGVSGEVSVTLKSCAKSKENPSRMGVVSQPSCIGEYHPGDIYADLNYSEFLNLYTKMLEEKHGVSKEEAYNLATSKSAEIKNDAENIKNKLLYYISAKMLMLEKITPFFSGEHLKSDDEKYPVIMKERNLVLSNYIENLSKSATAYGMAHISGVIELLKHNDRTWQVVNISYIKSL